mmetsp:Transcript_24001/g.50600  ORF Transcript_24001/g.50600 Transcript_24001/m.50600 type:complete len:438 (-) Transcript_24001:172-1485(-)
MISPVTSPFKASPTKASTSTPSTKTTTTSTTSTIPFILTFFLSMILHELALESISTLYSVEPYNFPHLATCITLFQFGFCVLLPLTLSKVSSHCRRKNAQNATKVEENDVIKNFPKSWNDLKIYVQLSAVVYGATALATMSLGYEGVTYVTKVVFKSAKLIPTMIVGVIMDRKVGGNAKKRRYGVWDYASAFLLCVGAAGFCMRPGDIGEEGSDIHDREPNGEGVNRDDDSLSTFSFGEHWIGVGLLTASVFCDAIVPNIQEQLMRGSSTGSTVHHSTKELKFDETEGKDIEMKLLLGDSKDVNTHNSQESKPTKKGISSSSLMVNTNSIGFTLLLLSTFVSSTFLPIISFATTHPHFLFLLFTVGMGLGTAVLAYTELIRRSGPAVAVTVATLRKVVTVMLSYIVFPKVVSLVHLASGCLVLCGLAVGFVGKGKKS